MKYEEYLSACKAFSKASSEWAGLEEEFTGWDSWLCGNVLLTHCTRRGGALIVCYGKK